jgi:hypothetical protein
MKPIAAAASLALAAVAFTGQAQANANDAIIAGAAGFAVGTLFGHAAAQPRYVAPRPVYVAPAPVVYGPAPWTPRWYSYCSAKYGSFDPRSGTYAGVDGVRYMCR